MPKSRGRRKKTSTGRVRTQLTPFHMRMLPLMAAAEHAEARGDAAAALEIMSSQPWDEDGALFWRPWRIQRLEQILRLEGVLPRWAVSRWILEQAMQAQQPSLRSVQRRSLDIAIALRGGLAALPGVDELDARARVMDNDWVYRQLFLYEYGALTTFLRRTASADLVAGADRIREWASVPMRGLRFVGREATVLHWHDLGSGADIDVPNLGAAALLLPGDSVLARLVPTEQGEMLEGVPLRVADDIAELVARDPSDWISVLRGHGSEGASGHATVRGNRLLTDVPQTAWQLTLLSYAGRVSDKITSDDLVDAAIATVRAAMSGHLEQDVDDEGVDPWPCIAAALVYPSVLDQLPDAFGPDDADALLDLAARLVGPAAEVCRELATPLRGVA